MTQHLTNQTANGLVPLYLEDIDIGQRFTSDRQQVDLDAITTFAAQFDPQPFHLDDEAASEALFGGLAASGWHTAAITMRLLVTGPLRIAGGIVGAGAEVTWPKPTRPGDELVVKSEVMDVVRSRSRPERGIVTVRSETLNQHGEVVQTMTAKLVVPCRTVVPTHLDRAGA
ncbi:MaoC family dehydratase [Crenobacter sp. SG2305]|uniref:MaoC family dehydratase n=1 Tax=Crenobacter oryzisoli TaxID=3056844 RepID=UPI0025AB3CCE|nr:MaoC family dehydratase [Crenobacter sp. SG2305]MDN0083149.1 MaoC family dehydratase [Crenobacter sp. SG2305]